MQTPTPSQLNELSKDELIKLLKTEQDKYEAMVQIIASISHDTRAPIAAIIGFTYLFLKESETNSSLTELHMTCVQGIKKFADRVEQVISFCSSWRSGIQLLSNPTVKAKISFAETKYLEQAVGMPIMSDMTQIPSVFADKGAILIIMELLRSLKNEEAEAILKADSDWVRFTFSNLHLPYWLIRNLDGEMNRLFCEESIPQYEPLCLVVALVEKYGGTVYAALGSDSTYNLSFTLPVYHEAT
jgi:signal transduction histidine kinase